VITLIRATLDRDLIIRSISGRFRGVVGESAFDLVQSTYHDSLKTTSRELFARRRMVTCEIATAAGEERGPRWWFVRAAPLCENGRVVAAFAHAVPRGYVVPHDWLPVDAEDWERELAIRELQPVFGGFDAALLSAIGWWSPGASRGRRTAPCASGPAFGEHRR
jgi:hypothetical protein